MNDDELERAVATALHDYFPEPTGSQPRLPDERVRHWPQIAAASGSVVVVAAAVVTIGLVEEQDSSSDRSPVIVHGGDGQHSVSAAEPSTPPATTAPPTAPRLPLDGRAAACRRGRRTTSARPLNTSAWTYRQAVRLADRRGEKDELVLAGSGGKCDNSSDAVYRTNPIALVFDDHFFRRHQNGPGGARNPRARIIAAEHVPPGWDASQP